MNTEAWLDDVENDALDRYGPARSPRALTVLYDPGCVLCRRCAHWLSGQPSYVQLELVPCTSEQARARYSSIPWLGDELVVVGDGGEVWVGPAAFLTCLWALVEWREWSYRLAGEAFAPLAERFFTIISSRRKTLGALLGPTNCRDGTCSMMHP
jgi:predicted DCC family thiol-disulfide oxidoreductase YuxK